MKQEKADPAEVLLTLQSFPERKASVVGIIQQLRRQGIKVGGHSVGQCLLGLVKARRVANAGKSYDKETKQVHTIWEALA